MTRAEGLGPDTIIELSDTFDRGRGDWSQLTVHNSHGVANARVSIEWNYEDGRWLIMSVSLIGCQVPHS